MTTDLYRASHARLRELMRVATGPIDPGRVTEMLTALRRRSVRESMLLHPIIGTVLPDVRASLDRQHALIEPLIRHVERELDAFVRSPSPGAACDLQATLRRFVGAVLPHMEEEEALAPLLAKVLSAEDLAAAARELAEE